MEEKNLTGQRRRGFLGLGAVFLMLMPAAVPAAPQGGDQEAMLTVLRERAAAAGVTRFVTPAPGSRSVIVAVDLSLPLYLFLERGSIRGSAIDDFYRAYDSGDMEGAYEAFRSSAIPTVRVTDYGWNGLGVPFVTNQGSEISDILYRMVGGSFGRAPEITDEDVANYGEYVQIVSDALGGS